MLPVVPIDKGVLVVGYSVQELKRTEASNVTESSDLRDGIAIKIFEPFMTVTWRWVALVNESDCTRDEDLPFQILRVELSLVPTR